MTSALIVHSAGPGLSVQDGGRPGYLAFGLSRGGAADRLALVEGAALLRAEAPGAALEMMGMGGRFEVTHPVRIALTGAPMDCDIDGSRVAWNGVHSLAPGQILTIGAARSGVYGYLHLGGGITTHEELGGRGTLAAAGLGTTVAAGDRLPLGVDPDPGATGLCLPVDDRFSGGEIRVVPSLQTDRFSPDEIARFETTAFRRDARGNRMGVRLVGDGPGFGSSAGLSVLSEVIAPGDIQITGDGTPFVLLSDCQTTGGYPRIGSVLPCDLPRIAQAAPGTILRFRMVSIDEGTEIERKAAARSAGLRRQLSPLVRGPEDLGNLLSHQLISGVTVGTDDNEDSHADTD